MQCGVSEFLWLQVQFNDDDAPRLCTDLPCEFTAVFCDSLLFDLFR